MTLTRIEERLRADLPRLADVLTGEHPALTEPIAVAPRRSARRVLVAAVAALLAVAIVLAAVVVTHDGDRRSTDVTRHLTTDPGWVALVPSPLGPRLGVDLTWTGSEILLLGGYRSTGVPLLLNDGAAYAPTTGAWRSFGNDDSRHYLGASSAWTGTELVTVLKGGGGAYDPATGQWRALPGLVPPVQHFFVDVVWTGRDVFGILMSTDASVSVARLDEAAGRWEIGVPQAITTSADTAASSAWTGAEVVFWPGAARGWAYAPTTGTWRALPPLPDGAATTRSAVTVVDGAAVVAYARGDRAHRTLGVARLEGDEWQVLAETTAPEFERPAPVVADGALIVLDGTGSGTPVRVDLDTGTATALAGLPLLGGFDTRGVWTGDGLFVWSGFPDGTPPNQPDPRPERADVAWLPADRLR